MFYPVSIHPSLCTVNLNVGYMKLPTDSRLLIITLLPIAYGNIRNFSPYFISITLLNSYVERLYYFESFAFLSK